MTKPLNSLAVMYNLTKRAIYFFSISLLFFFTTIIHLTFSYATDPSSKARSEARSASSDLLDKFGDKDGIRKNIIVPMTGDATQMTTLDGSVSFDGQLICPSSDQFLRVFAQPSVTGDLVFVKISQDTNLDGSFDHSFTLPRRVSGVCANGFISCDAASWNNCVHYEWNVNAGTKIEINSTILSALGGCYCINNSCGSNLARNNLSVILENIGGGIVSAILSKHPRHIITNVRTSSNSIYYYGQNIKNCLSPDSAPVEDYFTNWTAINTDLTQKKMDQSNNPDSYFNLLTTSQAVQQNQHEVKQCNITRHVSLNTVNINNIITPHGGHGDVSLCGDYCIRVILGKEGKNYWQGNCSVFTNNFSLHVKKPEHIKSATITRARWADHMQILFRNTLVWGGPGNAFPPHTAGTCDMGSTHNWTGMNVDVTNFLSTEGVIPVTTRVSVTGLGGGYAVMIIQTDDLCTTNTSIADNCQALQNDPDCRLRTEIVDGVYIIKDFNPTGLSPIASCRNITDGRCSVNLCKNWWRKERTYVCQNAQAFDFTPARTRMGSLATTITERDGQITFQDYRKTESGNWVHKNKTINLPEMEVGVVCKEACKVKIPIEDTQVGTEGKTGDRRVKSQKYNFFYRNCGDDGCPVKQGERIVKDCQCINEFAQATAILQVLRMAGGDLICSTGVLQSLPK